MQDMESIKDLLKENEEDIKLKSFLNKINKIFGEDYTTMMFASDYNISRSINLFTSKFENMNQYHIQSLLLQNALLSNNEYYINFINKYIQEENGHELFPFIEHNMYIRKDLTRLFIKQANKTNIELLETKNKEEMENIINNIQTIKHFERFFRTQERIQTVTKRKRGNRY